MANKTTGRDLDLFRSRPRPISEFSELAKLLKQITTASRKSVNKEVCEKNTSI